MSITLVAAGGQDRSVFFHSKWDEQLPSIELHSVQIDKPNIIAAWQDIASKYLLRCNFYMDRARESDSERFEFSRDTATAKEVLEAFTGKYSTYIYTQDKATGLIWIHPKQIAFEKILSTQITIKNPALQLSMYDHVLLPVCTSNNTSNLTVSNAIIARPFGSRLMLATCNYPVDMPSGTFSFRDILNFCCLPNPNTAFYISPMDLDLPDGPMQITPVNLAYDNPLLPPRTAALVFWKTEVGITKTGTPDLREIGAALADSDSRTRRAALSYLKAAPVSYERQNLVTNNSDPVKAAWAAIGLKSIEVMSGEHQYITRKSAVMKMFSKDLADQNPSLALLLSTEIARERNDPNVISLVEKHKFSAAETASIKPELIRIARQSRLVRDRLSGMKFDDPELSATAIQNLGDTNLSGLFLVEVR